MYARCGESMRRHPLQGDVRGFHSSSHIDHNITGLVNGRMPATHEVPTTLAVKCSTRSHDPGTNDVCNRRRWELHRGVHCTTDIRKSRGRNVRHVACTKINARRVAHLHHRVKTSKIVPSIDSDLT